MAIEQCQLERNVPVNITKTFERKTNVSVTVIP